MQNEERSDILTATADSVAEGELIDEGMAEAIRRMRACGMAKKAIARELGLDIKTVRKWAAATEWRPQRREQRKPNGVEIKLCRYYRAQTKGKVESGVKYVKRNALAGRRFETLEELNAWLTLWALTIADERVHGTTHEIPRERFERDERVKMIAVDRRPPSRECGTLRRQVATDGYVAVETNRYPVPYEWCRAEVEVQRSETEVRIVHGEESIAYERESGKYRMVRWNGPARPLQRSVRHPNGPADPPQYDPAWLASIGSVNVRPLDAYAAVAEEVMQ